MAADASGDLLPESSAACGWPISSSGSREGNPGLVAPLAAQICRRRSQSVISIFLIVEEISERVILFPGYPACLPSVALTVKYVADAGTRCSG